MRRAPTAALFAAPLVAAIPVAAVLVASPPAAAFPEGAPWDMARDEGCAACHFENPPVMDSSALDVEGLPAEIAPGALYRLTLRLTDPELARAGYFAAAWRDGAGAGRFTAPDDRSETSGAKARSTEAGSLPVAAGAAEWSLDWRAPEGLDGPVRFEVWANAANDDGSPLGDRIHVLARTLTPAP